MTPPRVADEPLLEDGDVMDAAEFRRRYELMPGVKKAELIAGVVHMASPVSWDHATPHGSLVTWLGTYAAFTPGVRLADNGTVRLDAATEVQPDAALIVTPAAGGRVRFRGGYAEGGPEFVAEVAVSSGRLDRGPRLRAYQAAGVREYLVVEPAAAVEWLAAGPVGFAPVPPDPADGLVKSAAFPGLWLDPAALARGDLAAALAALHRGLASAAHAAFAARLRAAGGAP